MVGEHPQTPRNRLVEVGEAKGSLQLYLTLSRVMSVRGLVRAMERPSDLAKAIGRSATTLGW